MVIKVIFFTCSARITSFQWCVTIWKNSLPKKSNLLNVAAVASFCYSWQKFKTLKLRPFRIKTKRNNFAVEVFLRRSSFCCHFSRTMIRWFLVRLVCVWRRDSKGTYPCVICRKADEKEWGGKSSVYDAHKVVCILIWNYYTLCAMLRFFCAISNTHSNEMPLPLLISWVRLELRAPEGGNGEVESPFFLLLLFFAFVAGKFRLKKTAPSLWKICIKLYVVLSSRVFHTTHNAYANHILRFISHSCLHLQCRFAAIYANLPCKEICRLFLSQEYNFRPQIAVSFSLAAFSFSLALFRLISRSFVLAIFRLQQLSFSLPLPSAYIRSFQPFFAGLPFQIHRNFFFLLFVSHFGSSGCVILSIFKHNVYVWNMKVCWSL